jgi:anti-anti-sigma regulatory factor
VDDQLKPGDHVCLLYDTVDDQLSAVARYASTGFGSNQQVLYLTDAQASFDRVAQTLRRKGIAITEALTSGQLKMIPAPGFYLDGGRFDASAALQALPRWIADARDAGFAGLRVATDMGWAQLPWPGVELLAWYEAQVSGVFADGYAVGLCCYPDLGDTPQKVGTAHPGTVYASVIDATWTPQLRLRIARNPVRLCVAGEIDLSNRDCLPPVLERLRQLSDPLRPLNIDFSAVTFADVATMRLLVEAAQDWPGGLAFIGCPEPIAQTVRMLDDTDERISFVSDLSAIDIGDAFIPSAGVAHASRCVATGAPGGSAGPAGVAAGACGVAADSPSVAAGGAGVDPP